MKCSLVEQGSPHRGRRTGHRAPPRQDAGHGPQCSHPRVWGTRGPRDRRRHRPRTGARPGPPSRQGDRPLRTFVTDGLASGAFKPTIDRTFPFDQIVEAHRYLEAGEQIGKIVVTV
ncbi:MAG: zinc-binding dehydrogenase [Caulobacteraceae bacterium]